MVGADQGQELGLGHGVDFVEGHDQGPVHLPQMGQQNLVVRGREPGLHQPHHHVGFGKRREGRLHQGGIQRPFGVQHSRGVQEQELGLGQVDDAQKAMPGGLGLGGGDGQLVPHQPVQQGGLAHVGNADEGHVAAFELFRHALLYEFFRLFPQKKRGYSPPFSARQLTGL